MAKKKERILETEFSPPPSGSESEPDSEALMRRRRREGFPFPEAVTLLETFLKEANEKVEETNEEYSRPGKVLTMEEISALDKKMLGLGAIIRRVGDKMKKLEEDCWREMEELLEGEGGENDRDGQRLSFLLTVIRPSCDASSLIGFLKINEFPYQMDSSFDALAPFAKAFTVKEEENTEIQEGETGDQVDGNTVTPSSEGPQATRLEQRKESVERHAVKAQQKVQKRKRERKQLEKELNKDTDGPEVKKEVKEEVVEMGDEGAIPVKDRSTRVGKEAPKRKEQEGEKDGGGIWKGAKIHAPVKKRGTAERDEEEDDSGGVGRDGQWEKNEQVDGMMDFGGMDSDLKDVLEGDGEEEEERLEKSVRKSLLLSKQIKCAVESGGVHSSDLEKKKGADGSDEEEGERVEKPVRRSCRQSKAVKYAMERESDDDSSDEDGGDSSDSDEEKEQRERMCHSQSRRVAEEEQEENEGDHNDTLMIGQDQTVDEDDSVNDGNEEKKCPVDGCTETLSSSKDLAEHMKKHPTPMICDVCKRSCPNGAQLRVHYRIHTGERPFECATCKKTFAQRCHLHIHQRIHSGEKPYACSTCEYKTSNASALKRHQRIYTGEKPFQCTVCKMNFAQSSHLTFHKRMHTGERPFECDICGYKASRSSLLKQHLRTHTGEKPHSCATCGYKTTSASSLFRHKKRHAH